MGAIQTEQREIGRRIGLAVRARREELGLTQEELALHGTIGQLRPPLRDFEPIPPEDCGEERTYSDLVSYPFPDEDPEEKARDEARILDLGGDPKLCRTRIDRRDVIRQLDPDRAARDYELSTARMSPEDRARVAEIRAMEREEDRKQAELDYVVENLKSLLEIAKTFTEETLRELRGPVGDAYRRHKEAMAGETVEAAPERPPVADEATNSEIEKDEEPSASAPAPSAIGDDAKESEIEKVPELLEKFPVLSGGELQESYPNPPEEVIKGIIGVGEKLILGGASKAGKTFCFLNLAGAKTVGADWLGFKCPKGDVLFINLEVSKARMAERNRLLKVAGVDLSRVDFFNLRGAKFTWKGLVAALGYLARRKPYALIIIDPIYKLLGETDENNNSEVASLMGEIDQIALETKAALAYAHHFSKGNKSEVASIDRLSGAGSFVRDPDAILTLTQHEEPGCFTLEATLRNYAAPAPVVIEYTFPLYTVREELDSARLKQTSRGGGHNKKGGVDTVVETLTVGGPMVSAILQQALMDKGRVSDRTARRWMKDAQDSGRVSEIQGLWTVPK